MLETRFIASIAERDIDLILVEEFSVSDDFRIWFANRVSDHLAYQTNIGVWHSVVDASFGESDIVYLYSSRLSERVAILIENKIDAPPQPEQAERYKKRGERGIGKKLWEQFRTCVVAPKRYLESSKHNQVYDVEISYEDLLGYFSDRQSEFFRARYKANVIQEAIDQNRRGYQPEYSPAMTAFVEHYYAIASRDFPQLKMQEAKPRPSGSTWITFNPSALPKGAYICHQLAAGAVKLFFSFPASLESVSSNYGPHISGEATLEQAGKSIALIMQVPKLDPLNLCFSRQIDAVLSGLHTAVKLLQIAQQASVSKNLVRA